MWVFSPCVIDNLVMTSIRPSLVIATQSSSSAASFAASQRLVLGQVNVVAKPNEVVAIPKMLGLSATEGAIITIDHYHRHDELSARHRAKDPCEGGRLCLRAENRRARMPS